MESWQSKKWVIGEEKLRVPVLVVQKSGRSSVKMSCTPEKNNYRGIYVMFEVEYLWNGWIRKDGANAKLI